jgi:putative membrane protein
MASRRSRAGVHLSLAGKLAGASVLPATMIPLPLRAQPAPAPPAAQAVRPLNAETFVRLAHSSASVQARAAELAATRETRPAAKAYAQRMVEFRRGQIAGLETAARDNKVAIPTQAELEHRQILENLEPLDYLALSRRYAEFQIQALEQELQIYGGAANSPEGWLRSLAAATAPELRRLLEEAREMVKAVGP